MPVEAGIALFVAAAVFAGVLAVLWRQNVSLRTRAAIAERRFDLLQQLAPSLTSAALDSTAATCARILDRLTAIVPMQTALCFYARGGRLVLGAKSGDRYAGFLRDGAEYEAANIIGWVRDRTAAAIVGPAPAVLPHDVEIVDLALQVEGDRAGPAAGSRDRVWALAVPLVRMRGYGLRPDVLGIVYVERAKADPFSADDLRAVTTIARLAADALARAVFADAVRRDAEIDGLTKLLTPTAFRRRLREEVAGRRDVALLFIDTDRFKDFNDTFGHAAGDQLLRKLANLFETNANAGAGFAGRNGGDEFCIALLDRTKDSAIENAERLRAAVEASDFPAQLGLPARSSIPISISVGVAHHPVDLSPEEEQRADRLLEIADAQMYEAKRAGRNRVEFLRLRAQPRRSLFPGEGPIPRR
jgi:diguanylate cyclase (GGDEF)-like protein